MALRPHTLKGMYPPIITECMDFILHREIFIDERTGSYMHYPLIAILDRDAHIPTDFDDDGIVQVRKSTKPAYDHLNLRASKLDDH